MIASNYIEAFRPDAEKYFGLDRNTNLELSNRLGIDQLYMQKTIIDMYIKAIRKHYRSRVSIIHEAGLGRGEMKKMLTSSRDVPMETLYKLSPILNISLKAVKRVNIRDKY